MSASRTCTSLTVCNLSLTTARCTGFTKVHVENDFTYVIDLEWTDERSVVVKRTFAEFQNFHNDLARLFPELRNSKLNLKTSLRENVASLFMKDKKGLAEKREAMLDQYLHQLLRQPERIRRCNSVLSFFDSRNTDPKPCKSNSPSEKADSGIDLTGERLDHGSVEGCSSDYNTAQGTLLGHEAYHDKSSNGTHMDTDSHYASSINNYDGDTSETETDDEMYDEDYFLDVGFGELMLQTSVNGDQQMETPTSPITDMTESAMWCSNLDKFSNILRSSMTNLNTISDNQSKPYRTLKSLASVEYLEENSTILDELAEEHSETREETSETESQLTGEDRQMPEHCESSDEEPYYSKPLSKTNMRHYYLSSNNLLNTTE